MAQRKLRLEIQQSQEEGECGSPRVPRWYGQHAITTNDITGSVMKILITDSKGKQISITIGKNGGIQGVNGTTTVEEDHGMWIDQKNNKQSIVTSLENTLEKFVKKELEEPEEPGTESSVPFEEVIEVTSEGYNNLESLDGSEIEEEFHAEMEKIKCEEISPVRKFETVCINSELSSENDEVLRPEQSAEFSSVMFESINDTALPLLCRLCATQQKDMVDIFGDNEAYKDIIEKIAICLPVVVRKTDALPKEVCRLCLEKLEMCYKFHKTVSEAEKQFVTLSRKLFDESGNPEKCNENLPALCNGQLDAEKPSEELVSDKKMAGHESCALPLTESPEIQNDSRKVIEKDNANEDIIFIGVTAATETVTGQLDHDIIKCRICGKYFGTAKNCYKHSDVHNSENHYPCNMCDETFTNKRDSFYHSQKHTVRHPHQRKRAMKRASSYNLRSNPITRNDTISNSNEKITEKNHVDNILLSKKAGDNQTSDVQKDDHDMVKCRICGIYFGTAKGCYTHSSVHASENHRPCSMCDKSFTNERDSYNHSLEHIVYEMQQRAVMYRNELSGNSPQYNSNRFSNSVEKVTENDEEADTNQIVTDYTNDNGMINCRICGVTFRNAKCCYEHSNVHVKKNHYPCCICYKNFRSERNAYRHNLQHTMSTWKEKLSIHFCGICGKRFKTEDRLKFHKIYHDPKMKPCYCEKCDKVMSSETNLYIHRLSMHNGHKEYNCSVCGKQFRSKPLLVNHQLKHRLESFECSLCNRRFFSKYKLKYHSLHHCRWSLNTKNYSCFYCRKTFLRKCSLTNHLKKHTDERPYHCEFCSKTYESINSRNKHQRIHTNGDLLKCSKCEKRFFDPAQLKKHENVHLENRPYNCPMCNKSFKVKKTRKNHIRAVHMDDKWYKCETCGRKFLRLSKMKLHQRTQHGIK